MKNLITNVRGLLLAALSGFAMGGGAITAQANDEVRLVQISGNVEILRSGANDWSPLSESVTGLVLRAHDRVRVGTGSSAGIAIAGQSAVRFAARSEVQILPPDPNDVPGLNLVHGLLSFFHRAQPGRIRVLSSGGTAGIRGTEFVMSVLPVNGVEQTTVSVLDGAVNFANPAGMIDLTNRQQAVATPGVKPARTTGFIANNILQWCFYYPGVLDLHDLSPALESNGKNSFSESVAAYRAGNLPGALGKFPDARSASEAEHIFHAALLLNNAQIPDVENELAQIPSSSEKNQRLVNALRMLIAAAKHESFTSAFQPQLATELLAASYYAQSQPGRPALDTALKLARQAGL
jgi:hypothetical protein